MRSRIKPKAGRAASAVKKPQRQRRAPVVISLDPEAPGLDEATRRRRRALAKMQQMSTEELFGVMVRAGIYTADGKLTAPYRSTKPSLYRPGR